MCDKYLVCSDSLSVLQEMENVMTNDHLVHRVQREFHDLITGSFDISFAWVPSHVGVEGNERADAEAKQESQRAPEFIPIPYRNWFPELRKRTNELWTGQGRDENRDFFELKPTTRKSAKIYKLSRREEVVINRLRLGHKRVKHGFLFEYEDGFIHQPMCHWCQAELLSIIHILLECRVLKNVRDEILRPALQQRF